MSGENFTVEEIRKGIDALVWKISKMGLHVHIIDPYFDGFYITRRTLPLSLLLTELIAHTYGQLHRIFFDISKKYKTASITTIHQQLIKGTNLSELKGLRHKELFDAVDGRLVEIKKNYKKRLDLYCNKYYAHSEIRSEQQAKEDYENFKMSWSEINYLITQAKDILNIMWLYVDDAETDFAEGQYDEDRRAFWKLIDPSVFDKSSIIKN